MELMSAYAAFPREDKKTQCGFQIGDRVPYNASGKGGVKHAIITEFFAVDSGNVWWRGYREDKPIARVICPCYISRVLTDNN